MANHKEYEEYADVGRQEEPLMDRDEAAYATVEAEAAAAADAAEIEAMRTRVAELETTAERYRDQFLRAQAELENQRRRSERELEAAHKYAVERFAAEMLTVGDNLELGLEAAQKSNDLTSVLEGTQLTLKSLQHVFEKFNITAVNPSPGERFDPEVHQAMTTQESAAQPPNTVLATMQKGYLLQGRVLRPAMVIVARAPAAQTAPGA